jgi:outer membrane protein
MKTITTFGRTLFTAALLAAAATAAQAQDLKIGYVNSEKVLREANAAKAAQAKLEAEFGKRERELNDAATRLKAAADKLDKDGPTLSESEKVRRQRELVEQDRDLQRKRREFQEDLNQRRNEELAAVVERANKAIRQIFDTEKYDLILQEVVFAGPRVDITDKVIRVLNTPAPAGK